MKDLFLAGLLWLVICALFVYSVYSHIALPEVHYSMSQNKCVKVIEYEKTQQIEKTCDTLPKRYNLVRVP